MLLHINYQYTRTGATSAGVSIIASPVYVVYVSQLIRYSRAYAKYSDFLDRVQMLTQKLLKQG
jgi:hypothetical protein